MLFVLLFVVNVSVCACVCVCVCLLCLFFAVGNRGCVKWHIRFQKQCNFTRQRMDAPKTCHFTLPQMDMQGGAMHLVILPEMKWPVWAYAMNVQSCVASLYSYYLASSRCLTCVVLVCPLEPRVLAMTTIPASGSDV